MAEPKPDIIEYAASDGSGRLYTIEPGSGAVTVEDPAGFQIAANYGLQVNEEASRKAIAAEQKKQARALYADPVMNEGLTHKQAQSRAREIGVPATGTTEEILERIAVAEAQGAEISTQPLSTQHGAELT